MALLKHHEKKGKNSPASNRRRQAALKDQEDTNGAR